jgi:hypothetical protein
VSASARGLVLGPLLLALLAVSAAAQSAPCAKGPESIKASALGSDVLREGSGLGAVGLGGGAADIERAWGPPSQCRQQGSALAYHYIVTSDSDDSALFLGVTLESGRADMILVTLLPHSQGRSPGMRTARGVSLAGPLDDVARVYGPPPDPHAQTWVYAADGIAFMNSKRLVTGIAVFRPGAPPAGLLR